MQRRLVLAAAIVVGASAAMIGFAGAQEPAPTVRVPEMQQRVTANDGNAANSNNNYQAAILPGPVARPTPGTMVFRMNGGVWSEFLAGGGSGFAGGSRGTR
jgi:hypothetical protein